MKDQLILNGIKLTSLDWMHHHANFNKIEIIYCLDNKLTQLPNWPNVKYVFCSNNRLKLLPEWPNITHVECNNNNNRKSKLNVKVTIITLR